MIWPLCHWSCGEQEQIPLLVAQSPFLIPTPDKNLLGPVPSWKRGAVFVRGLEPWGAWQFSVYRGKGRGGVRAGGGCGQACVCLPVCTACLHGCSDTLSSHLCELIALSSFLCFFSILSVAA